MILLAETDTGKDNDISVHLCSVVKLRCNYHFDHNVLLRVSWS